MDIMKLIDILDETVDNAWTFPFTAKCFMDKDELLESIQEIRAKIPEEIKEAKWVTDERQRIISDAQKEADSILKNTADKVTAMVSENEITRLANEEAMKIMEAAQNEARSMRMATKEYVSKTLNDLENSINMALAQIRDDRKNV